MTELAASHRDALDDSDWFAAHRPRRYRARQGEDGAVWLIRRKGRVFLRVPSDLTALPPDVEIAIESVWWRAAWPGLPPKARHKLMRESRPPRAGAAQRAA